MTDRKSHRVKIIDAVDIRTGRGLIAFKAGWSGPVVPDVFEKLMASGKAEDITPKPKAKASK